jgi:hypothetical protein
MGGYLFCADDPVEIQAGEPREFLSQWWQPGGVVAAGSAVHAGQAVNGKIGGYDDAHGSEIGRDV